MFRAADSSVKTSAASPPTHHPSTVERAFNDSSVPSMLSGHDRIAKQLTQRSAALRSTFQHGLIAALAAQSICCCTRRLPFALSTIATRSASSSSSRWLSRQNRDPFTKATKVNALKSRAAFKLLEIDQKHRIFKPGQTVVDLGYAPGSWSQVAISRVRPASGSKSGANGRVVGIDVIPAQPPRGVSAIQGNFLSAETRQRVVEYVRDPRVGRAVDRQIFANRDEDDEQDMAKEEDDEEPEGEDSTAGEGSQRKASTRLSKAEIAARDEAEGRVVDVVLSDMNEPWPLDNVWSNSVVNPYRRMMNTSGNSFKDHVGSMDLCLAALSFSYDTLKTGGSFLCKYYQGSEDKPFELRLKALFEKVYRIKPDSSRKESREAYFLALRRKIDAPREQVLC